MALDTRWKNPQSQDLEALWRWAQDITRELRKGDYLSGVDGKVSRSGDTMTGVLNMVADSKFLGQGGAEGGEFKLEVPASGTSLAGDVIVDLNANALRFFENGGNFRGLKVDLTAMPAGAAGQIGMVLLNSGTVSNAATLDIVLTSFTGYRAFTFILTSFVPATDDVELWMRLSTDGGSSYDATGYSYSQLVTRDNNATINHFRSASTTQLPIAQNTTLGEAVSNVASEGGVDVEVDLYDPTNTGRFPRLRWQFSYFGATQQDTFQGSGSGSRENAQNTDAVRFLFESGNIASGKWALYGYA